MIICGISIVMILMKGSCDGLERNKLYLNLSEHKLRECDIDTKTRKLFFTFDQYMLTLLSSMCFKEIYLSQCDFCLVGINCK
jgi:hypothetical protein